MMTGNREGFSLIEVVVAMVLLAIILTTLAGFTFATAQQARQVSDANVRSGIVAELVSEYAALPWDHVVTRTDIVSATTGAQYVRNVTVTGAAPREVQIKVYRVQGTDTLKTRLLRVDTDFKNPFCTTEDC